MSNNTLIEEVEPKKDEEAGLDEYEQSAQYLHILFDQFKLYGYGLANRKKKAPIRVLEAFLFGGLHDTKLIGQDEKELLALSQQVVYHKNKLAEYVLIRQEQEKKDERKKEE